MKNRIWTMILILSTLLLTLSGGTGAQGPASQGDLGAQAALGTAFTYQGYLTDDDAPADSAYDMQFALYDALSGGTQVGSTLTLEGVAVSDGVFTVQLDFGASAFVGDARYLAVSVRANGSGAVYTVLSPRQELTAAPYALYALGSPADAAMDALEQRIALLERWQGNDYKSVFLTQGRYGPDLSGLAGGDAICQSEADAAGLPGTYKAWLSTAGESPSTRFTRASVPYILPNGTMVAEDWADLTDGSILAPIDCGPDGEQVPSIGYEYDVWTATKADGTPDTYNPIRDCGEWTGDLDWYGMLGYSRATNGEWSYKISFRCWSYLHLYCFQQ